MYAMDEGIADLIGERCKRPDTKEELAACVLFVLKERNHNKFFQENHKFKKGDLKDVMIVEIRDERGYLTQREGVEPKKKIQFTTTLGNHDPDSLRWYAVIDPIDKDEDALILIKR